MSIKKKEAAIALATLAALNASVGIVSVNAATIASPSGEVSEEGSHTFTSGTSYIQEDFGFATSARVTLSAIEDSSRMGVGTVHNDGQYGYAGSTDGGAVGDCGDKFVPGSADMASFDVTGCTES